MSNQLSPAISLRSTKLPDEIRASVWASRIRQAKSDGMIIFGVFTFLGFGIGGIARTLLFTDLSPSASIVIGLFCGLLATLGTTILNFVDWPLIRRDLNGGILNDATIDCERAIRVRIEGSSLAVLALDCGNEVLLLIGEWWLNKNRHEIWNDQRCRKRFPTKRFRIQYLPRSGYVVRVDIEDDRPVTVVESQPVEPMISVQFPKYSEVAHVKQDLQSLILKV